MSHSLTPLCYSLECGFVLSAHQIVAALVTLLSSSISFTSVLPAVVLLPYSCRVGRQVHVEDGRRGFKTGVWVSVGGAVPLLAWCHHVKGGAWALALPAGVVTAFERMLSVKAVEDAHGVFGCECWELLVGGQVGHKL